MNAKIEVTLVSEHPSDLLGLPAKSPLLSWSVDGALAGAKQLAAELEASASADFSSISATESITDATSQFVTAPGGAMASRESRYFRVRIQTEAGWSNWSNLLLHEVGLVQASDYLGEAIGDVSEPTAPPALLRKEFVLSKAISKARLYATAHGTFDLMINGKRVGNEVLAPGWTPYDVRLQVVTHDVTALLTEGANAWGVLLADGWYRGHFGFTNQTGNYGTQTKFLGQLEVEYIDGSTEIIATDSSWLTSTGGVRSASIYHGTDFDFNFAHQAWCKPGFDVSAWNQVTVHPLDKTTLEPRFAAPVRVIQQFKTQLSQHNGNTRVNVTQNISGWLKLKVKATAGSKLVAKHAEVLEPNGDIHTKALRFARATDTYVFAADGEYELEPKQTFHGFQYADLIVEAGSVEIIDVTGIAVSSDLAVRGQIETSHPLINKLVSNTFWSLRDNFVSIPTDCPQRDERLGWTGDAQAFVYAAHSLVNGYEFYKTWLRDLEIEQTLSLIHI
jgi:alpha-L-rhamnosidase